jgi:hypothetical protein
MTIIEPSPISRTRTGMPFSSGPFGWTVIQCSVADGATFRYVRLNRRVRDFLAGQRLVNTRADADLDHVHAVGDPHFSPGWEGPMVRLRYAPHVIIDHGETPDVVGSDGLHAVAVQEVLHSHERPVVDEVLPDEVPLARVAAPALEAVVTSVMGAGVEALKRLQDFGVAGLSILIEKPRQHRAEVFRLAHPVGMVDGDLSADALHDRDAEALDGHAEVGPHEPTVPGYVVYRLARCPRIRLELRVGRLGTDEGIEAHARCDFDTHQRGLNPRHKDAVKLRVREDLPLLVLLP